MIPDFLLFLLVVIGFVLLSLAVDKTTLPGTLKTFAWAMAVCAVGLFALYCGLLVLDWLGLHARAFAQTPGAPPAAAAEQHGDIVEKTVTQLPIAFVAVKVIEWAKRNPWIKISDDSSTRALALVNAITAFVVAVGITMTFETVDAGHWRFTIDGPIDLGSKLWAFVTQWSMQQFFYERHQERKVAIVTHNILTGTGDGGGRAA